MGRRQSPLIAILCTLFLLGAQQVAYAHWISHVGVSITAATAVHSEVSDDGNAASFVCTTCAAFAALTAAPPKFIAQIAVGHTAAIAIPDISSADVPACSASPYTARAPPAVL